MKRILSILGLALLAMNVWAQQALFSGNDIVSPEVHPDGTVTFRLYAPKAVKVELTGDFLPQVKGKSPMGEVEQPGYVTLKEEKGGLWTYTSEKLADELYSYKFRVDGMDYLDPSNVYMCRDIASYTTTNATVNTDGLNARLEPSTSGTAMMQLSNGTTVAFVKDMGSGWSMIEYNGKILFVSQQYITKN